MTHVISIFLLVFTLAFALAAAPASAGDVKVFAAASLKTALDDIGSSWTAPGGEKAVMVYAGSSTLAKQITAGAPADLFISADLAWMDDLDGKGLIDTASRHNLLGNTLVLIAPRDSTAKADLSKPMDLAALLGDGRLSVAAVEAVPAGRYAKAALNSLGLWGSVSDKLAQSENVRAALAFVARGEAPLGIVYGSDAVAEPKVRIVAMFPASSHPPIIYPAARVAASQDDAARDFLTYLSSPTAAAIFNRNGFTPLSMETQ